MWNERKERSRRGVARPQGIVRAVAVLIHSTAILARSARQLYLLLVEVTWNMYH